MKQSWQTQLNRLNRPELIQSLSGIKRGFEKESLRIDEHGILAKTPHPEVLGSSLTHPLITTDYSEALLEFITPPLEDLSALFESLTDIHHFTYLVLKNELLWAGSMPCHLPKEEDIPIANYGFSHHGLLKHIYRRGLGYRYGRIMQTISGIHYNFSFPREFWEHYKMILGSSEPLPTFISEHYLGLIRNFLRWGWLMILLFGASPAFSSDFLNRDEPYLEKYKEDTYYGPYATSLRLSDLGYQNKAQSSVNVSYNSLGKFIQTLDNAVHTPYPLYKQKGVKTDSGYHQLSDNILQLEDEHYAMIRPKRVVKPEERMLSMIATQGVEYIEIRSLDINPFVPIGIERDTSLILDVFLTFCLFENSPLLTESDKKVIDFNHSKVAKWGRKPKLVLLEETDKPRLLQEWGTEIVEKMQPVAEMLDKAYGNKSFSQACLVAMRSVQNLEELPSAKILKDLNNQGDSYFNFTKHWSKQHQAYFQGKKMATEKMEYYQKLARESLTAEKVLEKASMESFAEYLDNYLKS